MSKQREIDRLYIVGRSLEAAAQAATTLALEHGATAQELEATLKQATAKAKDLQPEAPLGSPLGEAQRHVQSRREICRAVSLLALEHGAKRQQLAEHLEQVTRDSALLQSAHNLTDLGF